MNKEFYQQVWGDEGYYEYFSYGVGIDYVCKICLTPFFGKNKTAVELGSGGGVFTEKMVGKFKSLIAIDVIRRPKQFRFIQFVYIELPDKTYRCEGVKDNSIDFCFSYNLFCHLSNEQLIEYVKDVNRVLKSGGDFVFMLSNYEYTRTKVTGEYKLGELLPMGHYYQDERTLDLIMGEGWDVVNPNMIPEHRDIIVHLKKK
jgi:SAM-dependent methyltransferase